MNITEQLTEINAWLGAEPRHRQPERYMKDLLAIIKADREVLRELLDAYVEENGGDMPSSDSHPAHDARRRLDE